MLASLHIENIAVIRNADIEFRGGFNALTGETGAGKSLLLGSIGLLTGERPQRDMIRSGEETATVSAVFTDPGEETEKLLEENGIDGEEDGCLYISRRIQTDGKAQTRINGRTVPVSVQKQIAEKLINIHGQHDSISLLESEKHIVYLDMYSGEELQKKLSEYGEAFGMLTACERQIAELRKDGMEKERLTEILKYQISDIDSACLKPGEEEALEAKKKMVADSERVMKQSRVVARALVRNEKMMPAKDLIERAVISIDAIKEYIPKAEEYIGKLTEYAYEIEDIAQTVAKCTEVDFEDPTKELDKIEERLDRIKKLEKKYGSHIEAVLAFRDDAKKRLSDIETSDERLEELEAERKKLLEKAEKLASALSEMRRKSAEVLEKEIAKELAFLDMPKVRFEVGIEEEGLSSVGKDKVEFLISANPGEPPKPISRIASGGELSRIMLALKTVNIESGSKETMIFDEIDAGISGATSQKIGIRLKRLGENNQIICVTHSAQVAATADTQYLIRKEEKGGRVETFVRELSFDERVMETARIMGGMNITESLVKTARELVSEYNKENN